MRLVGDPHLRNGVCDENVGAERRAATAACLLDGIPAGVRRYEGVVHHVMFPVGVSSLPVVPGSRSISARQRAISPRRAELGSTIRGTGVKGLSELGSSDVALHPAPCGPVSGGSSRTRSAWWFPSLRRSSGPLTPWRRGRLTGRWGGAHGSALFGSIVPGGGLFSNSQFELNRESRGMLSLWSCRTATCGRRWPGPTTRAAR